MSSHPAPLSPDLAIDRVLHALRTTEPPAGLEQRIAARLAQASEARTPSAASPAPSPIAGLLRAVAPAKLYTAAALTLAVASATLAILNHRSPADTVAPARASSWAPALPQNSTVATTTTIPSPERAAAHAPHPSAVISPSPSPSAPDLDQIALAETLAPSHPAPPMPLTAQEHLMLAASRPGQPIQLAELGATRAPLLPASAKSREEASIDRYVKRLLFPFALADALSPATDSQPQERIDPAPPPSK